MNFPHKKTFQVVHLGQAVGVGPHQLQPSRCQGGEYLLLQAPVLAAHDVPYLLGGHPYLGFGTDPRRVLVDSRPLGPLEGRHPHHEELVKVGRYNRKKPEALQGGQISAEALFQHPSVEVDPGKIAAEKPRAVFAHVKITL